MPKSNFPSSFLETDVMICEEKKGLKVIIFLLVNLWDALFCRLSVKINNFFWQ